MPSSPTPMIRVPGSIIAGSWDEDALRCLHVSRDEACLTVSFSRPLLVGSGTETLLLMVDESPLAVQWRTPDGRNWPSPVWVSQGCGDRLEGWGGIVRKVRSERFLDSVPQLCDLPATSLNDQLPQHSFCVIWMAGNIQKECVLLKGDVTCSLHPLQQPSHPSPPLMGVPSYYLLFLSGCQEGWCRDSAVDEQLFRCELSVEKSTVLQSELESCKELQELEPENKWCLLTIILLMRALDPLLYEKETLQYFETLKASWMIGMSKGGAQWEGGRQLTCISCWPVRRQAVDPMRAAYLDDLRSKFLLENSVLKMEYAEVRVLHLGHKDLTVLCHLEQLLLVTHLDLSHNRLRALPPALAALRCLEVLQADDNVIETLDGVTNLPRLQELSLCDNSILLLGAFQTAVGLVLLNLQGNPLCEAVGISEHLAELLPSVSSIVT
ncbi:hypothetical protein MC885_014865 [Smutsia gigantea]|nr:hypothetical protein MC885_014865 [Smutsia gigantea]